MCEGQSLRVSDTLVGVLQVTLGQWPVFTSAASKPSSLVLCCKTQDLEPIRLCMLVPGNFLASINLDLLFSSYTEFSLLALNSDYQAMEAAQACSVHISGCLVPHEPGKAGRLACSKIWPVRRCRELAA